MLLDSGSTVQRTTGFASEVSHVKTSRAIPPFLVLVICYGLLSGQEAVYGLLKIRIGLCAYKGTQGLDFEAIGLGKTQEKRRRPCHPYLLSFQGTTPDGLDVFAALQALLKLWHIEGQRLRMSHQVIRIQRILMRKELCVHLPEFALLTRAMGRLGSLYRLGMHGQRKIPHHIFDLPSVDVILHQLRQRLTDVATTEGSLIIGKVDERESGIFVALKGLVLHPQHRLLLRLHGLSGSTHKDGFQFLELLLQSLLISFNLLQGLLYLLDVFAALRKDRRRHG